MKKILILLAVSLMANISFAQDKTLARTADRPEDYKKLGIDSKIIAKWEDGM